VQLPALEPCVPPDWARGGHAQTIWADLLPSKVAEASSEKIEIAVSDGDRVVARYYAPSPSSRSSGVLVSVFHGLGGDIHRDYMRRTTALALAQGHTVLCVNHRGCGEGAALARRPYHSGRAEDLAAAVAWGRSRHPDYRHGAIGFSLSANALLLLLGRRPDAPKPDFAVAVNAPIALDESSRALSRGFNRIYDLHFIRDLRRHVRRREQAGLEQHRYAIPRLSSVREFDELYTAKAGGFSDRDDYYARSSAKPGLKNIAVPTVLLHAEDDPFIPIVDYRNAELSPSCALHIEKTGGHMGYLTAKKTPLGTKRWLDYALTMFLDTLARTVR
jgi:predicted alpha/beta-fold hydrolase